MQPPYKKSSCAAENTICNPILVSKHMALGLLLDYVTWKNLQKWIATTSNLHLGQKIQHPLLWV